MPDPIALSLVADQVPLIGRTAYPKHHYAKEWRQTNRMFYNFKITNNSTMKLFAWLCLSWLCRSRRIHSAILQPMPPLWKVRGFRFARPYQPEPPWTLELCFQRGYQFHVWWRGSYQWFAVTADFDQELLCHHWRRRDLADSHLCLHCKMRKQLSPYLERWQYRERVANNSRTPPLWK